MLISQYAYLLNWTLNYLWNLLEFFPQWDKVIERFLQRSHIEAGGDNGRLTTHDWHLRSGDEYMGLRNE